MARNCDKLHHDLGHPVEVLRLHAAWALGRVGGDLAVAALQAARSAERTSEVSREIDLALIDARGGLR